MSNLCRSDDTMLFLLLFLHKKKRLQSRRRGTVRPGLDLVLTRPFVRVAGNPEFGCDRSINQSIKQQPRDVHRLEVAYESRRVRMLTHVAHLTIHGLLSCK